MWLNRGRALRRGRPIVEADTPKAMPSQTG
jgi:hypothetical protein